MAVESGGRAAGEDRLQTIRHSASHVMAGAVRAMFPGAKFGIGPAIENGFYYDFDLPRPLTPEDLPRIEEKMRDLIGQGLAFRRESISREAARQLFENQPYKLELIEELAEGDITVYRSGDFVDLCAGPHVASTKEIPAAGLKLEKTAGAYWRGSEKNPMLQRIYGLAFASREELDEYLKRVEEQEARDHRRLNRQLGLYIAPDEIGGGLPIYGPKAGRIRTTVEDFWRQEHYASGYELLYTPHIGRSTLWQTSGHLDFYKENMYSPMDIEGHDYYLKPMNCPFHILFYKSQVRSYRDLPLRWAELGTVYRFEASGVLHGLLRVRGFTQDDAHIICTPEQIDSECAEVLRFSLHMWRSFGFHDYCVYLATRPKDAIGSEESWERAAAALRTVIEAQGLPYKIDEGGGAFYGPKIDLKIRDALGREWQMTTIQFDFNLPEKFDMVYTGTDGRTHRPYMVHRALLGSWERFFGLLIEHYAGAFPPWLAPTQAVVIPITERHAEYARKVGTELKAAGIRVEVNDTSERMNQRIRSAQLEKVPYMLIVGDKEAGSGTVSVRLRTGEQLPPLSIAEFRARALEIVHRRENEL